MKKNYIFFLQNQNRMGGGPLQFKKSQTKCLGKNRKQNKKSNFLKTLLFPYGFIERIQWVGALQN